MKRYLSLVLSIIVLITTLLSNTSIVLARTGDNDGSSGSGQMGLRFVKETGNLHYEAINKQATSGIKYESVAWIIRMDTTCNSTAPLTVQCTPLKDSNYIRINSTDFVKSDKPNFPNPGQITTIYEMDKDTIMKKLEASPKLRNIKDGQNLYFSTVFRVTHNGVRTPTEYVTLSGIRSAELWANKSGFRQYYDQPIAFSGTGPVKIKLLKVKDKSLIDSSSGKVTAADPTIKTSMTKLVNTKREDEEWPISNATAPITLPKTYVGKSDGKTYKLKCSYLQTMEDESRQKLDCGTAKTGDPNSKKDGNTISRNPFVQPTGNVVTAYYEVQDDITCKCTSSLSIPNSSTVGGEITTPTIGKQVPVVLNVKQATEDQTDWKVALTGVPNVKLKVDVTRTGGSGSPTWVGTPASEINNEINSSSSSSLIPGCFHSGASYLSPKKHIENNNKSELIFSTNSKALLCLIVCTVKLISIRWINTFKGSSS
ncbi:hypothetical protein [Paenibacillus sp. SN-8-1]|uniref:hypothetical protein n=1 Tax=Paenibacillus sp. SN-8-1 TaxID=3435409 RepID=UPI003D9A7AEF